MRHPIWTLYSRRFSLSLGYWLSALGLDWRDRSTSNRLYMVYFFAFWAGWAVAAFALLGSWVAGALSSFSAIAPEQIALGLSEISLVGWGLYSLWRASRRSPFVFTDEDAHLICQTPVSRPGVALALFLLNWYEAAFPFAVATIAVCFGVVEAGLTGPFTLPAMAGYLRYALRGLSLILPLHLGLQASAWAVGALRLRGRHDYPSLRWLAPAVGALLVITPLIWPTPASPAIAVLQQPWLWPLNAALGAAFAPHGAWIVGALLALVFAAASLALLLAAAQRLSFNRAAQETTLQATLQGARRFGRTDLAQALAQRQRLGTARPPSPLLARPGSWVILSKAFIQTSRGLPIGQVLVWLYIGGLGAIVLISPSAATKLLMGGLWVVAVGNAATTRLRSDLANWWLLRLLPIAAPRLFLAELALPWFVVVVLGELAVGLVPALSPGYRLAVGACWPLLSASAAFAAGADVLRQAHVRTLMVPSLATENVQQPGLWGVLQGLASVAVSMALLEWSVRQTAPIFWGVVALGIALIVAAINFSSLLSAYRWID